MLVCGCRAAVHPPQQTLLQSSQPGTLQCCRTSVPKGPPDTSKKINAMSGSKVKGFFLFV